MLFARESVELTACGIDLFGNVAGGAGCRPLEEQMLDQVRDPVVCRILVP